MHKKPDKHRRVGIVSDARKVKKREMEPPS